MRKLLLPIFLALVVFPLIGQKIKYTKEMLQKIELLEVDLFEPTEGKYKSRRSLKNDYQKIDHAIVSKKEGLEIRYALLPYRSTALSTQLPQVEFIRVISSVAPNEEEIPITVHSIPKDVLKEKFNADWGSMAFFQPKPSFSSARHCRLLSLYAEEKGQIHVFFFFDTPNNSLEKRFYAMRFSNKI